MKLKNCKAGDTILYAEEPPKITWSWRAPYAGNYEVFEDGRQPVPLMLELPNIGPCLPLRRISEHHPEVLKALDAYLELIEQKLRLGKE